jgi:hypothetical protein
MYTDANLHRYIESSRRSRRGLATGLGFSTLLALLVSLSHPGVGLRMLGVIGVIAACGFWILSSHINDWEGQLSRRGASQQR